jgi:Zinc carboxypeptidase
VRIVVMPLVNPGGLLRGTRANPSGVDLMRNAPVECLDGAPALFGGHRLSATLPWYRGAADQPMQPEAAALCTVVEERLLGQSFALALDCHSGFGQRDRIWFPHAHTARPIEHLPELLALSQLMEGALPHHPYLIEPQSRQYLAHGDLWDHLYLQARHRGDAVFLPLTLEMGSWLWIKKNPSQALTRIGLFNPHIAHRRERVLRRHLHLLDFLLRATAAQARWRPPAAERAAGHLQALSRWYPGVPEALGTAP